MSSPFRTRSRRKSTMLRTFFLTGLIALVLGSPMALAAPPTGSWTALTLSRLKAHAAMRVDSATALVLRADRDTVSLKVTLRPAGEAASAGTWRARLVALPATAWEESPDMARA